MQPYIVEKIEDVNGKLLSQSRPQVKRRVLKEETSRTMRDLMEQVVLKGGGRNAYVAGYRIGGKSGTSQKLDSEDEKARIASFVGVAPINDPKLAVLICLDEPHSWSSAGGSLSAPVVAHVIEESLAYLGYEKEYTPEEAAKQLVTVPDLVGRRPGGAKTELNDMGLNGKVMGEGERILAQNPQAGEELPRNSTVLLYTEETESRMVEIPDLTGMTVSQARAALQRAGLNLKESGPVGEQNTICESFRNQVGRKVQAGALVSVDFLAAAED